MKLIFLLKCTLRFFILKFDLNVKKKKKKKQKKKLFTEETVFFGRLCKKY